MEMTSLLRAYNSPVEFGLRTFAEPSEPSVLRMAERSAECRCDAFLGIDNRGEEKPFTTTLSVATDLLDLTRFSFACLRLKARALQGVYTVSAPLRRRWLGRLVSVLEAYPESAEQCERCSALEGMLLWTARTDGQAQCVRY